MTVTFTSRLSAAAAPLKHAWEHTVGSGRALLALRADWQEQLQRCHDELGFRHVRFHALLTDDIGTLISHQEKPLYSFFNADRIWDFLLSIGMRPFVELGFMPEMLASGHETVFHFRGNVTPPADYDAWATLIRKLVGHWVERYGIAEVRQWFFEVWNEPNLPAFWTGTQDDYFTLYRHTAQAIKSPLMRADLVNTPVFHGGPVQTERGFVLHEPTFALADKPNEAVYASTMAIPGGLEMTTSKDVLEALSTGAGPRKVLVSLGYSAWGQGQLESELGENSWLTVDADSAVIFDTPVDQRYDKALLLLGLQAWMLSGEAGHA